MTGCDLAPLQQTRLRESWAAYHSVPVNFFTGLGHFQVGAAVSHCDFKFK